MRRTALASVFTMWLVGLTSGALADGRGSIAESMGPLRWGMSQSEAMAALIEKIEGSYAEEIARTRMTPKETDVRRRMKAEIADLRAGTVSFNGNPTRWDNTFLEGEFTHGNGEALLTYADSSSRNFYFFIDGKLWKWVKAFDQPTFSGKDFDDFSRFVRSRFGGGAQKRGQRTPQGNAVRFMELGDSKTRLRAFDRIGGDRSFALVFEDKGTIGRLASLRKNRARAGQRGDDREVASRGETISPSTPGRFGDRRSLSANEEQHQESETEFRERQARENREARQYQQEQHARRQQAQRGRTLDGLAGMNDADPLSGFGQ